MERLHIKHLSGSKAGLIEEFVLDGPKELSIGRSSTASVKYKDDLVSRSHAKIVCGIGPHEECRISDLGSANGTFVNDSRITSSVTLAAGDRVRFGPNGPEFRFDVSPQPRPRQGLLSVSPGERPIRGTVIAGAKDLLSAFFDLGEKRTFLGLFFRILRSPTQETMRIVTHGDNVSPFRFMAFAYGVLAVTQLSEPLLKRDLSFADEIIKTLLVLVFFIVFSVVQYKILRDVSRVHRTFHDYLVMSAIVGGVAWLLLGTAQAVALVMRAKGPGLLLVLTLGATIYSATHSIRTSKRFWGMSYGKIFLYSFLSAIAGSIAASIVLLVLAMVLGVTLSVLGSALIER